MVNGSTDTLLRSLEINSLFMEPYEDKEGNLWIGTHRDNAIAFYGNEISALLPIPYRYIEVKEVTDRSLHFRSGNNLYTHSLSWKNGVPVLGEEVAKDTFIENKEPLPEIEGYEISDYLIDRESNKWYTTLGAGVDAFENLCEFPGQGDRTRFRQCIQHSECVRLLIVDRISEWDIATLESHSEYQDGIGKIGVQPHSGYLHPRRSMGSL